MFSNIMNMITQAIVNCLAWMDDIFGAIGADSVTYLSTAFLIACACRLLLMPIIGTASSDTVSNNRKTSPTKSDKFNKYPKQKKK